MEHKLAQYTLQSDDEPSVMETALFHCVAGGGWTLVVTIDSNGRRTVLALLSESRSKT